MNSSYKALIRDLKAIGLESGDTVIVHSSLSSMGFVCGGADTVIDALLEVIGKDGTLMFPALSYRTAYRSSEFSVSDTPSCVGKISEVFRKRDGVLRSCHPTHSVCAVGRLASEMVSGHELDDTPIGENSPYRKLISCGGKILMLGCGLSHNTFMHGVEEIANVPYALRGYQTYKMTDALGNVTERKVRRHNFVRPEGNINQRYERAASILTPGVDINEGKVHGAVSYLIKAQNLLEKALAVLKVDPYYFVEDTSGILGIGKK